MREYLHDPLDPLWLEVTHTDGCGLDPAQRFHKKIAIGRGLYDPRLGGGVWSDTKVGAGVPEEDIFVLPDESDVPPEARIIQEYAVDDLVGRPYRGVDGRMYQDVHTHLQRTASIGSVPTKQQVIQ